MVEQIPLSGINSRDAAIMEKIFETVHHGKVQFIFFKSFLLVLKKNYFGSMA